MMYSQFFFAIIICLTMLVSGCASHRWSAAQSTDSINAYREFLDEYPDSEYKPEAEQRMHELAYKIAARSDTALAYRTFLNGSYGGGTYRSLAQMRLDEIVDAEIEQAFEKARKLDTIESYRQFMNSHPSNKNVTRAIERIEEISWSTAEKEDTVSAYQRYLTEHRNGRYVAKANIRIRLITEEERKAKKVRDEKQLAESISGVIVEAKNEIDRYKEGTIAFIAPSPFSDSGTMRPATRKDLITYPSDGNDIFVVVTVTIEPDQPTTFYPRESIVLIFADGSKVIPDFIEYQYGGSSYAINPGLISPPFEKYNINLGPGTRTEMIIRFETKKNRLSGAKVTVTGNSTMFNVTKP